jgi:predicted DsbA family dithiol-disulfide isomerase
VSGVPTFVVAEKHVVTGAQPPELWMQVIDELREAGAASDGRAGPLQ